MRDNRDPACLRLFLCGDVMLGRGIDQVLEHPCSPEIHEGYTGSAEDYVRIAEEANGPIPRRNGPAYVWGAALDEFERMRPEVRIINLETAITRSNDYESKGINYRMSPENAECLSSAKIDCCVLANNHVLDWGSAGLKETLATLERLNIRTAGAGRNDREARAPAVLDRAGARVLVFSFGSTSSGIPYDWAATEETAGVNLLPGLTRTDALQAAREIAAQKKPGDLVIASIHWGSNWGYHIPREQQAFARTLVDEAGVSIVHGHSSHHPRGMEIYRNRLILYGSGDFLNDYEGISGYEQFRGDLTLMYFADLEPVSGELRALTLVPLQIRNFLLRHPSREDIGWLRETLDRKCRGFGTRVAFGADGQLAVTPSDAP